jgi:hypothetical protein
LLLLAGEEIAQKHEHHEAHDHDNQASEEKADEFAWSWARQ